MNKKEVKKTNNKKKPIFPITPRTIGQKASDLLTKAVGSWIFIILLLIFIGAWIYLNITAAIKQWDPWPFIILNLCLSCLAAIQAPIILMSQNRQTERDRQRSEYDYTVNRKAEREIREIQKQLNRIERVMMRRHKK
jgi:uncharacterized membrane protein